MKMKIILFAIFFSCIADNLNAQLKFLVEDFEGFTDGTSDLKPNGVFAYGNIKANIDKNTGIQQTYSGERFLRVCRDGKMNYGGWGKGISLNIELDQQKDYLNFYVYQPLSNGSTTIKIELQEDDNGNGIYEKDKDDSWIYSQQLPAKNSWELISVPLSKFSDDGKGGDGIFNVSYKQGKLFCFAVSFPGSNSTEKKTWYFDFICFSQGGLPVGKEIFDAPSSAPGDLCNLGAWSGEANVANFTGIAEAFEKIFRPASDKKLGVVHLFQPFAGDGGSKQNFYPSVERINKIIESGYIPMVTLENHFVNTDAKLKQPNLYSIVEGHFDAFFAEWAKEIKQVKGTVLLRILHEFNGDWYPWCIVNNNHDPALFIKAFRHIHDAFKAQGVTNVKFIWCPNSMSLPQEKWNFIMDAYPGDEYVDFAGLDAYNGAGKAFLWRSFRKEGIENYFILTQQLPGKPLLICETSSRERTAAESKSNQDKAQWIGQMNEALKSDMSKIRLLTWFNEKGYFKVNSSDEAEKAFLKFIMKDDYFKSGIKYIYPLLKK